MGYRTQRISGGPEPNDGCGQLCAPPGPEPEVQKIKRTSLTLGRPFRSRAGAGYVSPASAARAQRRRNRHRRRAAQRVSEPFLFDAVSKLVNARELLDQAIKNLKDGEPPWDDSQHVARVAQRYVAIALVDISAARTHHARALLDASYTSAQTQTPPKTGEESS